MLTERPTKLTAEQQEALRERQQGAQFKLAEDANLDIRHAIIRDIPALLAHIAALEGELGEQERFHAFWKEEAGAVGRRLEAALREVYSELKAGDESCGGLGVFAWSEPTARVLKELGV